MKYEVVEVEEDIFELRYKDKAFKSKRNIELVKEYQDLERKAKVQFVIDLQKDGYIKFHKNHFEILRLF